MLKLGIRLLILQQAAIPQNFAVQATASVQSHGLSLQKSLLFAFPRHFNLPGCLLGEQMGGHNKFHSSQSKNGLILLSTPSSDSSDVSPVNLKKTDQNFTAPRAPTAKVGALAWQRPGQPLSKENSGQRPRRSFRPVNRDPANDAQGTVRSAVAEGMKVTVVKKEDQRTGVTTEGIVMRLLTKSSFHPRGIKV
jgi:uncharacterized repeat protein (TIGR03833 family)